MSIIKKSAIVIIAAALSACEDVGRYGNRYDGLLVQDGNGDMYKLKHKIGDVYFVQIQNRDETGAHDEANKKLVEKAKAESE